MARNQQKADELATYYKITQQGIKKLKEEEEKLIEAYKAERDPDIRFKIFKTRDYIRCREKSLNRYAHEIVECLYGE